MNMIGRIGAFLGLLGAAAAGSAAPLADPVRGGMLYDNNCIGCHASVVHIRQDRRSSSLDAVRGSVRRWADAQNLEWTDSEVEDVSAFLDGRYYRFGSPDPAPAGSRARE